MFSPLLTAVSQIQDFRDLQDLRHLQEDVIYTSIFILLIYYAHLIPPFIATRNTISHHIYARDVDPGDAAYLTEM